MRRRLIFTASVVNTTCGATNTTGGMVTTTALCNLPAGTYTFLLTVQSQNATPAVGTATLAGA